ncbi:deoxyribodipyrimidine photo-lyase [Alteromonas sp. 14N.309.X.WAT.G.H12]|uniref:cryptochrome/photolyase family protein n=1 Tax=Alteromonas sp. 14N.309.X.WAT.G.H12 TaxID=3120824 RepID=UPI002FD5A2D4
MTVPTSIVWFRQDLRVKDNPALNAACDFGNIVPVYIDDTRLPASRIPGGVSKWWLHQSLTALNKRLNEHLIILAGDPRVLIPALMDALSIDHIFWNRCYEPWNIQRDIAIKKTILDSGKTAKSFNASLLWEPWDIQNKSGLPYKVFTPFYRKGCLQAASPRYPQAAPPRITYANMEKSHKYLSIDELDYLPKINWYDGIAKTWQPGEEGAASRLATFIEDAAAEYKANRDFPSVPGTSMLSAHLHAGEISPHQIWYALKGAFGDGENTGIDTFLSELGWREFAHHLVYHFPDFSEKNFNQKFDQFPWRSDDADFDKWKTGMTGIPIVDAGMRELWHTGFMHNRVRMVVGSFLVKNLLMDWRKGEAWFWDCLADADVANNTAGWQWIAGSGADASPYFRVFNPVLQGEKFDKEGAYVSQWCPELKNLPAKYIHKPWEASKAVLEDAGIRLGEDYPLPMVDLKVTRERALQAFNEIKGK